jgi:hypothetical protein
MFGLITGLIWVDSWIVELMASRKNSFKNRLDVGWEYGIDIDKNSRHTNRLFILSLLIVS